MSFDPFLYVALGAGFAAGRATKWRSPRVGQAALATVALLLFLLGDDLGRLPGSLLLGQIPLAAAFAVSTLGVTLGVVWLFHRPVPRPPGPVETASLRATLGTPIAFLVALLLGAAVGALGGPGPGAGTEYALYALLALVGFDLELEIAQLRSAWIPLLAAATGAVVVATVFAVARLVPASAAFSTAFAFGWYSLAGPLTAVRLGPALGLFAFLANFLRENLTMLSAPVLGRRVRGDGLSAMGGATSMDTTLYFVTRYGDAKSATVALATGVVLTTAAAVLLPLILGLA